MTAKGEDETHIFGGSYNTTLISESAIPLNFAILTLSHLAPVCILLGTMIQQTLQKALDSPMAILSTLRGVHRHPRGV